MSAPQPTPDRADASAPNVSTAPASAPSKKLGFVTSVVLIMLSLFTARTIANNYGFTQNRLFADDVVWTHVLIYFAMGISFYIAGAFLVQFVRAYMARRQR